MMLKSHLRPAEPLKHDYSSLPLSLSLKQTKKNNLYLTGSLGSRIKVLDNGGEKKAMLFTGAKRLQSEIIEAVNVE